MSQLMELVISYRFYKTKRIYSILPLLITQLLAQENIAMYLKLY